MDTSRLADLEEIKRLKARYFRTLDTKQWTEFGDVFTEDCSLANGPIEDGVITGRDEIVAYVKRGVEHLNTVHHGHMPEIELVDETNARGTWAMFDYIDVPGKPARQGYGRYHETYRKEAMGWRIASLELTRLRVDALAVRPERLY